MMEKEWLFIEQNKGTYSISLSSLLFYVRIEEGGHVKMLREKRERGPEVRFCNVIVN